MSLVISLRIVVEQSVVNAALVIIRDPIAMSDSVIINVHVVTRLLTLYGFLLQYVIMLSS
jgi:hypothetical protein